MTAKDNGIFLAALIAAATLITLLLLSSFFPQKKIFFDVAIIMFEVAAPFEILRWLRTSARNFNIYAHNIDAIIDILLPPYGVHKARPHLMAIARELAAFVKISTITLLPYAVLFYGYQQFLALTHNQQLTFSPTLPPQLFYEIVIQIFVVAMPEEIFYRGYLQGSLLKKWPNHRFIFGIPSGRAILLTNTIFAIGHLVVTWSPSRLLTFFPGMIFSYLVFNNKSLLSAILYHATCNILSQILYLSFG